MSTLTKNKTNFTVDDLRRSIENFEERHAKNIDENTYFGFPIKPILDCETQLRKKHKENTAYLSMEYGIAPSIYNMFAPKGTVDKLNQFYFHDVFSNDWLADYLFKIKIDKVLDIPIYGGGLGVLAGDTMKSISDNGLPVVGFGILWNKGYFKQNFWYKHGQLPEELKWDPHSYPGLVPLKSRVSWGTKQGVLSLRMWKYYIYSHDKKFACPLILLDTNIEENKNDFRPLTDQLYRSDDTWWKIFQRAILGIGALKAIEELQYQIGRYHLNEGHAAFSLIEQYLKTDDAQKDSFSKHFVYTCHTPVVAGHDRFSLHDLSYIMPEDYLGVLKELGIDSHDKDLINLTEMCLRCCTRINAVSQKHGEVMQTQFPQYAKDIRAITNGIHIPTWATDSFQELFDKYKKSIGHWRDDPKKLGNVRKLTDNLEFRKDIYKCPFDE